MRRLLLASLGLGLCSASLAASAAEIGLPTEAFVQSWTALPTGRFTLDRPTGPFKLLDARANSGADAKYAPVLRAAFTAACDSSERRAIALTEMATSWDQGRRSAFQQLRDAEADYAGPNDARHRRFVSMLTRLVDGVGRSAANDGSASTAVDTAYAATLSRRTGDARVAAESQQEAWRTYRDAFAAFADLREPGAADGVTAELDRQRANDLAGSDR